MLSTIFQMYRENWERSLLDFPLKWLYLIHTLAKYPRQSWPRWGTRIHTLAPYTESTDIEVETVNAVADCAYNYYKYVDIYFKEKVLKSGNEEDGRWKIDPWNHTRTMRVYKHRQLIIEAATDRLPLKSFFCVFFLVLVRIFKLNFSSYCIRR